MRINSIVLKNSRCKRLPSIIRIMEMYIDIRDINRRKTKNNATPPHKLEEWHLSNIGVRSVNILHGYLDGFALSVGIVDGDEVDAFGRR